MRHARQIRLSALDVLLLSLLLICLIGGLRRVYTRENAPDIEETVYLHVLLSAAPAQLKECLSSGDTVYTASGELLGKLLSVEKQPARVTILSDGQYHIGEWDPDLRVDLHLKIAVKGQRTEHGVLCAGTRVAIGTTLPQLYTRRSAFCGILYKIEP